MAHGATTGKTEAVNVQASEYPLDAEAFAEELTALCRKHRCGIEGGQVWSMRTDDTGPDADMNARYAIADDGCSLIRTFTD